MGSNNVGQFLPADLPVGAYMSARETSLEPKTTEQDVYESLRLEIGPVIERAELAVTYVAAEMPLNKGLARAARGVTEAAYEAKRVSRRLGKLIGRLNSMRAYIAPILVLKRCCSEYFVCPCVERVN